MSVPKPGYPGWMKAEIALCAPVQRAHYNIPVYATTVLYI